MTDEDPTANTHVGLTLGLTKSWLQRIDFRGSKLKSKTNT